MDVYNYISTEVLKNEKEWVFWFFKRKP
jgi:hypothetical protein